MERIDQIDAELMKILKNSLKDPFVNPAFQTEFERQKKFWMNSADRRIEYPASGQPKKGHVTPVTLSDAIFGSKNIMVTVEWKELNKSTDLFVANALKKETGIWYPPINRNTARPLVHKHAFFELFYVFRGSCVSTIENQDITFFEGDACLYNLNAVHSIYVPSDTDIVFCLLIHPRFIEKLLSYCADQEAFFAKFFSSPESCTADASHLVLWQIQKTMTVLYIRKIILAYFQRKTQEYMEALFHCLFMEILDLPEKYAALSSVHAGQDFTILDVTDYIEQNCTSLTLEELSGHFHYTPRNMTYYIKKYTNKTFSDLMREFRIRRAAALLSGTALSMEEITEQVAYNDRSYLDKLFKSETGMTMTQYRKMLKASRADAGGR